MSTRFPPYSAGGTASCHTEFNQAVAATGRLSSANPNSQNIPIRTEIGHKIREAFIPSHEDWMLLAPDYSQIELRVLAHLSKDPRLTEAFLNDQDIHRSRRQRFGLSTHPKLRPTSVASQKL